MAASPLQQSSVIKEPPVLTDKLTDEVSLLDDEVSLLDIVAATVATGVPSSATASLSTPVNTRAPNQPLLNWMYQQQLELPLEPSHTEQPLSDQHSSEPALSPHVSHTIDRIQSIVDSLVSQYLPLVSAQLTAELTKIVHEYLHTAKSTAPSSSEQT